MPKTPDQVRAEIAKRKREMEARTATAPPAPAPVAAAPPPPAPKPAPVAKATPKPAPAPKVEAKPATKPAPATKSRLEREADEAFAKLSSEDRAAFTPPTFAPAKSLDEKVEQQEALERWRTGTPTAKIGLPPVSNKSTVGDAADFMRPDEETVLAARTAGNFAAGLAGRAGTEAIAQGAALVTPGGALTEGAAAKRESAREAVRGTLNPAIDAQFARTAKDIQADAEVNAATKPVNAWEDAPENKPLLERAQRIQQAGGNRTRQQLIRSFLEGEAKENRRLAVTKLGGEDKITDATVSDAIDKAAREKAKADLVKLHQIGAWAADIRPEDLDPDAPDTRTYSGKVWDAFRPQSTVVSVGNGDSKNVVTKTENLPWWFVSTVFDAPAFGIQAGFDAAAGDDFADAFLRNVEERRTPLTARIDADEDLRADLASGDLARVGKHFGDPAFMATLGIEFLSPDIVTSGAAVATSTARVAKAAKKATAVAARAGDVSALLKADKNLTTLDAVRKVAADIDAESAPAEVARQKVLKYVDTIEQTYAETGDIEAAAAAVEETERRSRAIDSATGRAQLPASVVAPEGQTAAKVLRDAYLAKLAEDTEVGAYLDHLKTDTKYKGRIPPTSERKPVAFGDAEKRQLDKAVADLDTLGKQKDEILKGVDADIAERIKATGPVPEEELAGMKKRATREVQARLDATTKEAARLKALEQAKAGESKFDASVKQAGDDIVAEWGRIARGEEKAVEAPEAPTPVEAVEEKPRIDPAELQRAFGGDVSPSQAARIAAATSPEEVIKALRGTTQETKDAVARRLGAADYAAFVKTMAGTDEEVDAARAAAQARVEEARGKVVTAKDRYLALAAAPEEAKRLAGARKALTEAEAEVRAADAALAKAGKASISGRAKTRDLVQKADAAEAELARLRAEGPPAADSAKLENMRKSVQHQFEGIAAEAQRTATDYKREAYVSKETKALQKKVEVERALLNDAKIQAGPRATRQAALDKLVEDLTKSEEEDTARWYVYRDDQEKKVLDEHLRRKDRYEKSLALVNGSTAEKNAAAVKDAEATATQARAAADEALVKQQRAEANTNAAFAAAQTRRAEAGAKYDAARAAYDTTPQDFPKVPAGVAGDERIANAQQAVLDANKKWSDLYDAAREIDKLPEARENLRAALAATQSEYASLAEALGKQAEDISAAQKAASAPLPKGADPALEYTDDLAALGRRFDLAARDLRRLNRGNAQVVIENIYDAVRGIGGQYGETEDRSLSEAAQEIGRRLDGEMKEVDVSLSRAVDAMDTTGDAVNEAALVAAAKHLAHFKAGVRAAQMDGKYVALAATAYLNPRAISTLPRETGAKMLKIVRDWAADGNASFTDLRETLLAASRDIAGESSGMRAAQEGDIYLAQAVGKGGVERGVIVDLNYANLAYGEPDARAVNSVILGTFDRTNATGGNRYAARGRELASRLIVDPHLYQNPKSGWLNYITDTDTGTRDAMTTPLVKAVEAGATSKGAEEGIEAILEAEEAFRKAEDAVEAGQRATDAVAEAMKGDRYIPRALRDKMLQHVEAATATTNLTSRAANLAAYQKFWQQVAVVGSGLSRPIQFVLDPLGDFLRRGITGGEPFWWSFPLAVKAAARSLPSHLLGAPFMAQAMMFTDKVRPGAKFGDSARAFDKWISNLVFASPVDDILARSNKEVLPGITGEAAYIGARDGGIFENSFASQYTRSVEQAVDNAGPLVGGGAGFVKGAAAGAVVGGLPGVFVGGLAGAVFGATPRGRHLAALNVRYLQDLQNVAATRRRLAIYVGFIEAGRSPAEAAKKAVQIVGDFSRELGPAERGWFSTIFPFWAYRKFSIRSAVTRMLLDPNNALRANMVAKGGEGLAAGLSIALDSDDEYGYHPDAMRLEADPEDVQRIKDEIAEEKGLDYVAENDGWWEAEARSRADNGYTDATGVQHPPAPRAIERYERAMEELRKLSYGEGLAFRESMGAVAPDGMDESVRGQLAKDLSHLDVYWAPSPLRSMLPSWAQSKPAVFMQKARSQKDNAYYQAGSGKFEKPGDEIRFGLLPQDPFTEGMGFPLLLASAALNIVPGEGFGTDNQNALLELIGGMFADPVVIQAMSELNLATAAGMSTRVAIPTAAGENLQSLGIPVHVAQKTYRGQDPTSDGKDKYKNAYFLDAQMVAALYMIQPFIKEPTAAMDFMKAAEAVQGDSTFVRGIPDTVDKASVATNLGLGMRTYTASPSMNASFAAKDVDARIKAANEKRGTVIPETPSSWVGNLREMSRAKKRADFTTAADEMLVRVRAGDPGPGDAPLARAWLAQRFPGSEESLARLKTNEVFASVQRTE